jgi:tetratricopeptide (TPR) repeat protein
MSTDSDVAIPAERTVTVADTSGRVRPRRRPRAVRGGWRILRRIALFGLVGGLAGFNAWWYWRDTRPLADARAIEAWIGGREYDRAESALRERLRRAPHDVESRTTLARVLAARGDLVGCARELDRVPYWSPRKPEALFREAQAYLSADRARDAEAALLAILDDDPLHPPDPGLYHDASQELLKIYALEDRWEDAYEVIWKAYDHAAPADQPLVLSMRIRSELERVAPTETAKVLRRYLAADPADFEALRALAKAELALGQRAEAVRDMEACLRGRPEDPRAWRDYLAMLESLGEQEAFDAALARVPRSAETVPEIWMFRGQVKERGGDSRAAAEDYRKALELNPNLTKAHYRLTMIEERQGHREQAAAHRKRWQELRDARGRLSQVSREYRAALDAAAVPEPKPSAVAELRAATRRLASTCAAMGWARAAEAYNQLAAGL